jgi:putative membrane protein
MLSYLWLKAFHIVAVTAWMAGLFYLPRLFVYHRSSAPGSAVSETFKVMERRLYGAIMMPAMVVSWILGIALAWITGVLFEPQLWFVVKAVAVVGLTAFHFWLGGFGRQFGADKRPRTERFFRMINEIPTLVLIVTVVMAVVKPI